MKPNNIIYIVFTTLFLSSCNSSENNGNEELYQKDSLEINETDTSLTENFEDDEIEESFKEYIKDENPAVEEAKKEIVKKYGAQWDFCTCIKKSDSVNNALMEASDDEFDAVMERSEYIDSKCKELLIRPNATPEDRLKHDKKVKKCLAS